MCNSTIKLGMVLSMNNEKILEAARKNKNRGKEFEQKESTRSSLLGSLVALLVGIAHGGIGFAAIGKTRRQDIAVVDDTPFDNLLFVDYFELIASLDVLRKIDVITKNVG